MNADQDPRTINQDRLPLLGMAAVVRGFGPKYSDGLWTLLQAVVGSLFMPKATLANR
jgi:hypothetical protein